MLNSVESQNVVQFKATNASNTKKAGQSYSPRTSPNSRDVYVKQQTDKKEKWYKAGVIAGVVLAASFAVNALMSVLTHKHNKKLINAQVKAAEKQAEYFADEIAKKTGVVELGDDGIKALWRDIKKEKNIDDLILPQKLKNLAKRIENGIRHPDKLRAMGSDPEFSILLYGPPGTGKTAFSMGIAKKFPGSEFAYLDVGTMKDMWHGGSEKKINALIDNICKRADEMLAEYNKELSTVIGEDIVKRGDKKEIAKAIMQAKNAGKKVPEQKRVFVLADEIDSIMMVDNSHGAKLSNDMLNEFKKGFTDKLGRHENITVFGCTNLKINPKEAMTTDGKMLDKAMLDRFETKELVDLPSKEQLLGALKKHFNGCEEEFVNKELVNGSPIIEKFCELVAGTKKFSFREWNSLLKVSPRQIVTEDRPLQARDIIKYLSENHTSYNLSQQEVENIKQALRKMNFNI